MTLYEVTVQAPVHFHIWHPTKKLFTPSPFPCLILYKATVHNAPPHHHHTHMHPLFPHLTLNQVNSSPTCRFPHLTLYPVTVHLPVHFHVWHCIKNLFNILLPMSKYPLHLFAASVSVGFTFPCCCTRYHCLVSHEYLSGCVCLIHLSKPLLSSYLQS